MNQANLMFDPPATRSTDPVTSHIAEHEHTASGRRASHRDYVRQLVQLHPGSTARELARWARLADLPVSLDYHEVVRRLNDLADDSPLDNQPNRPVLRGEKVKCPISGRACLTWWPK